MIDPTPYSTEMISMLPLIHQGKVRDSFALDDDHMLIVASDRLSAFDVVLPDPMPGKGVLLTQISNFWFERTSHIIDNHLTGIPLGDVFADPGLVELLEQRSVIVRRLQPLPLEAIVRGYLIGSGWKDYQASGAVCGIRLPDRLQLADQLPAAIYTPSTKAELGGHDINIDYGRSEDLLGARLASRVREVSLQIYNEAARYASQRGIIIADTKFEFGLDENGELVLIDEALTPDSSRFWPQDEYRAGISPPSFDKQFVRDYLETLEWDKTPPGPKLPDDIIQRTAEKYQEALWRLTGERLPTGSMP